MFRIALIGIMLAVAAPAAAADRCNAGPKETWRPQSELELKLTGEGWNIRRVKTGEGCYEVYATDGDGKRREVYFNPKTFDVVADES